MLTHKTIIIIATSLLLVGLGVFLFKPKTLTAPTASVPPQQSSLPTVAPTLVATPQTTTQATPSGSPMNVKPIVTFPQPNSKITSPLVVKGSVPAGWMFEGVFPIKLLDANRNMIVQAQAKEVAPGMWSSGKSVDFSATLSFTTQQKSGFLVLEKDNPSGLPANAQSFEIPVNF